METITKESLFEDSKVSIINTRQKRYNNVRFKAELVGDKYVLISENGRLKLDIFDEIVLYIISKFRFCPSWLVRQWYKSSNNSTIGNDLGKTKLRSFIDFGLLYEFPSAVAVFLMPTDRLASMFNINLGSFVNPPYNTLTHTISEEQIMFDCMTGKANYLKGIKCIPYVSSLGLGTSGAICIPESDYSIRNTYFSKHIEEFNDQEARLIKEMIDGNIITTPDFKEFKLTIHKKIDQYNYDLKIPDLAVLAPRVLKDVDGMDFAMPKSVALEVELTCKGTQKYIDILDIYWDNVKFGTAVYLVNAKKTRDCIVEAYKEVRRRHSIDKVSRTCDFKIIEFEVPYNREQLIRM